MFRTTACQKKAPSSLCEFGAAREKSMIFFSIYVLLCEQHVHFRGALHATIVPPRESHIANVVRDCLSTIVVNQYNSSSLKHGVFSQPPSESPSWYLLLDVFRSLISNIFRIGTSFLRSKLIESSPVSHPNEFCGVEGAAWHSHFGHLESSIVRDDNIGIGTDQCPSLLNTLQINLRHMSRLVKFFTSRHCHVIAARS